MRSWSSSVRPAPGKSTLCRTINRLETIQAGTITVDGRPLPEEGKELARLRAEVGMIFQSFNLFAHKTALENVSLGPVKVRKQSKAEAERRARELLDRVGLAEYADRMPGSALGRSAAACRHRARPRDGSPSCSSSTSRPPRWTRR